MTATHIPIPVRIGDKVRVTFGDDDFSDGTYLGVVDRYGQLKHHIEVDGWYDSIHGVNHPSRMIYITEGWRILKRGPSEAK